MKVLEHHKEKIDEAFIIADVASQYKALKTLIEKVPKCKIFLLGDIFDRGEEAKETYEYLSFKMKNKEVDICAGNHEWMMLNAYEVTEHHYQPGIWQYNGGGATLKSFGGNIPKEVLSWIKTFKKSFELEIDNKTFYISHAFKTKWDNGLDKTTFYWNRRQPEIECFGDNIPDIQIAGHNSHFGLKYWNFPNNKQAICIDTSASAILTGIHLPSMKIYQQEYL